MKINFIAVISAKWRVSRGLIYAKERPFYVQKPLASPTFIIRPLKSYYAIWKKEKCIKHALSCSFTSILPLFRHCVLFVHNNLCKRPNKFQVWPSSSSRHGGPRRLREPAREHAAPRERARGSDGGHRRALRHVPSRQRQGEPRAKSLRHVFIAWTKSDSFFGGNVLWISALRVREMNFPNGRFWGCFFQDVLCMWRHVTHDLPFFSTCRVTLLGVKNHIYKAWIIRADLGFTFWFFSGLKHAK